MPDGPAPPDTRAAKAPERSRAGRRPGNPDTRATIVAAAGAEFAAKGYDAVSMRAIARVAGVDPSLLNHYFGSKDDLLLAWLDIPFDPRALIPSLTREGVDGLGARIATTFLTVWDKPENQPRMVAMLRAVLSSEASVDVFGNRLVPMVLGPISQAVDAPDGRLRAQYVVSHLLGLAVARYVLRLEPLASTPASEVAGRIAPTLQRYLDTPNVDALGPDARGLDGGRNAKQ